MQLMWLSGNSSKLSEMMTNCTSVNKYFVQFCTDQILPSAAKAGGTTPILCSNVEKKKCHDDNLLF